MLLVRTFLTDIRRIVYQKKTWISLAVTFVIIVLSSGYLVQLGAVDVLTLCCTGMTESANFLMITAVLPMFVYSAAIAEDQKNHCMRYFVSRSGLMRYAISKYLSALMSGMLTFALGMIMAALFFSIFFPFYNGSYQSGDGYARLIESGHTVAYFVLFILHYMLSAACFSVTCFCVASYFEESFIAYTLPIMIYFFLQRFGTGWNVPYWIRPGGLIQSIYDLGSISKTFWLRAAVMIGYCIILGLLSIRGIVYKVRNN